VIDDAHLVGFGVTRAKADLGFFGKFHKTILTRAEGTGGAMTRESELFLASFE
jgi:hypothetical protein